MLKKALLLAAMATSSFLLDEGGGCNFGSGKGLAIIGGVAILGLLFGTLASRTTTTT